MTDSTQRAYLDVMGIDVWRLRNVPSDPEPEALRIPGIKLGPGSGGILLVCADAEDCSSRLANDIGRALGCVPVWAWLQADNTAVQLNDAVDEHLFTTVAIFGNELASRLFANELPANLNSAKLVLLPAIQEIRDQPAVRQSLWGLFCRTGMVSSN